MLFIIILILVLILFPLLIAGVLCFFIWLSSNLHLDSIELAKLARDRKKFDSEVLDSFIKQRQLLGYKVIRLIQEKYEKYGEGNESEFALTRELILDEFVAIHYKGGRLSFIKTTVLKKDEESKKDLIEEDEVMLNLSDNKLIKKQARNLYWIGFFLQHALHPDLISDRELVKIKFSKN